MTTGHMGETTNNLVECIQGIIRTDKLEVKLNQLSNNIEELEITIESHSQKIYKLKKSTY